jgi:hypothetical protein
MVCFEQNNSLTNCFTYLSVSFSGTHKSTRLWIVISFSAGLALTGRRAIRPFPFPNRVRITSFYLVLVNEKLWMQIIVGSRFFFSETSLFTHSTVVGLETKSHIHVGLSPTLSRHVAIRECEYPDRNRSSVGSGAMPLLFL